MIKKRKINQKIKGIYIGYIYKWSKDHCTVVSFNKKAIRGNHYHKKSIQYSFILEGKLLMYSAEVDNYGKIKNNLKKIVKKNDLISHKPFEAHAFKTTKSLMLAFADGLRGGKNYEKDTFRLKKN